MEVIDSMQQFRQFVDPAVSKAKLEQEVALFMELADYNQSRGAFLIKAEFPNVVLSFLAYKVRPVIVAFTVRVNFTNYDVEPPSVQFIDPVTEQLLPIQELTTKFPRQTTTRTTVTDQAGRTRTMDVPGIQELLQSHAPNHFPFFCIPGVREYHAHPYHSNDPWLNHRTLGEGSLGFIVDQLHKYGTEPIVSIGPQSINIQDLGTGNMLFNFNGVKLISHPSLIPA